jgi:hypothetical protein
MELKLAEWASAPPSGFPGAIEPPTGKKQEGWDNGEEPGAPHINWIFQAIADLQNEAAALISGLGGTLSATNLSQQLAAIQRQAFKSALNSVRLADDLGAGTLHAIARAPSTGRIVAVGDAGLIAAGDGYSAYSTELPGSGFADTLQDVIFDTTLNLFIAVGDNQEIQTSPSSWAGAWTQRNSAGTSRLRAVATDGAGHLVAVGGSEAVWTSSNGTSWANRTAGFAGTPDITSVAFGAGTWVIVTNQGDIASSTDHGGSWTVRQALAGGTTGGRGGVVAYDPALGFIYHYTTNVYRSTDGVTWTQIHASASPSNSYPGLIVTPSCWALGHSSGDGAAVDAYYSPTDVNATPSFRFDHILDGSLSQLRVSSGQLMGVSGSKIYFGGVL